MEGTVEERVKRVIAEFLGVDIEDVQASESLTEDLNLDSIELVQLGQELEDEFDFEVPDSIVSPTATVGELAEAISGLASLR